MTYGSAGSLIDLLEGFLRKYIALVAAIAVAIIVPAAIAATSTQTVCQPGHSAPSPYCSTVTLTTTGGTKATQKQVAKAAAALASVLSTPSGIANVVKKDGYTYTLAAGAQPGTYTVTVIAPNGTVIGVGTATVASAKTGRIASAGVKVKLTKAGKAYLKSHEHQKFKLRVTTKYKPKHGKSKTSSTRVKV